MKEVMTVGQKGYRRTILIVVFGIGIWAFLVSKLFSIQVLHNREYRKIGLNQHQRKLSLYAQRGDIFDRDGAKLVFNLPVKSYYAVPVEIKDPQRLATLFGQLLSCPSRQILASFKKPTSFVWLARKMSPVECQLVESWNIQGIYDQEEIQRYYPGRALGCQLLGFTDIDNKGLEGIELQYDDILAGHDGWVVVQMDACGRTIPMVEYPREEPSNGLGLVLSLHASYQAIAERELARGVQDTGARAGCVILMDPKTGEILALANEPRYDLNDPGGVPAKWRRNRAITDMFEPGSTFKIVTAAAALEEGIQKPDDLIYCEGGQMRVCSKVISDVEKNEWLTFQKVIEKSSNIGTIKVARQIGQDTFYQYARAFGFGNQTGVELPGEVKGLLAHPHTWSQMSLPSMSIGHEVAVTPLQLICAYAAVANGGVLMKPQVVRYILDGRGNVVERFAANSIRRVVTEETAAIVRSFLTQVVENGTGKLAGIDGLHVAGKTGTAYKLNEDGYGFSTSRFVASFCGFFPSENPRLVGLVVLDEPKSPHSGGKAAAPVFRRIMENVLHLPKGPCADLCMRTSDSLETEKMVVVPDLNGLLAGHALELLGEKGFQVRSEGEGAFVCHQQPPSGALVGRGEAVVVTFCSETDAGDDQTEMPAVVGLTIREAIRKLQQHGLQVKVTGSGLVIKQMPRAHSRLEKDTLCQLECQPSEDHRHLIASVSNDAGGSSKQ
jgi:stage V sporulation protein D (sporulation-specific penicillin-binding protein)